MDDELARLRAENARLTGLLVAHNISWRPPAPAAAPADTPKTSLATASKIQLFRRLFQGRTDVYPVRWESQSTGKSGYTPACGNEWRAGVCEKPRIKCGDCTRRALLPLTDQTIYDHLAGRHTLGVYPLLPDDSCHFLAVDFDEADWRDDVQAFARTCRELGVPVALEISRSGKGAHAWVFFASKVSAREARQLGTALISHTCASTRQLKLSSYDRLFPNQDTLPKGGFGNLIALPLQKQARENGGSVFVDDELHVHDDQWAFLASVSTLALNDIAPIVLRATGKSHPLDVTFITDDDEHEPWAVKKPPKPLPLVSGGLPEHLTITLANLIYFDKGGLPQALMNRLIRLAAFQNPEFYKAQAMRLSVWNEPRVIGCAENFPAHVALPRGCLDAVCQLLDDHQIGWTVRDERCQGTTLKANFKGMLRADQQAAVSAMAAHDTGILCAPTAFGKTVTAAALIAQRGVNTLVLVHRTELLKQWQARLETFLDLDGGVIGTLGGGKSKRGGAVDIAVMQSLSRAGEVSDIVADYGQVIVDECHHLSAFSFESLLKKARARYVLGLTATPFRRDGRQPIIFMQCGPMRHTAAKPLGAPQTLEVHPRFVHTPIVLAGDASIQNVFHHLADDDARTEAIAAEIEAAFSQGRKVLVLTERTDHLTALGLALAGRVARLFTLHGRMSKKQRTALVAELDALAPGAPRVLLSTGKLVGEGFDHAPLDTLVLAMPISWKGTLQQYAGRLHREQAGKDQVRIVDFVDTGHPAVMRMWEKRQRGYKAMGYQLPATSTRTFAFDP